LGAIEGESAAVERNGDRLEPLAESVEVLEGEFAFTEAVAIAEGGEVAAAVVPYSEAKVRP
jgi:glutamate 5-kinase